MQRPILILGMLAALTRPSFAAEWRIGLQNVEVKTGSFAAYDDSYVDDNLNIPEHRFINMFALQYAREVREHVDVVVAGRGGYESGRIQGVSSTLWMLEPGIGVRGRLEPFAGWKFSAQALVTTPLAFAQFYGPQRTPTHRAFYPSLQPSVGAAYFPLINKSRKLGAAFDVGYSTNARLSFNTKDGRHPGTLSYGGITYGLFLVWSPNARKTDAPSSTAPVALPAPAVSPVQPEPVTATAAPPKEGIPEPAPIDESTILQEEGR